MPHISVSQKLGCLVGIAILLTCICEPLSSEQKPKQPSVQQDMPETRELVATETIPFLAPPPLLVVSGMKCDLNGNIYLVYTGADPHAVLNQPNAVAMLPISKLSLESKTTVQYTIPSISNYQNPIRFDFNVDSSGTVYALVSFSYEPDQKGKGQAVYLLVKYKDDGTMDSYLKIGDIPGEHIQPLQFAAFPNGTFLITGTSVKETTLGSKEFGTFTAVFDRGGTFAANVDLRHDVEPEPLRPVPETTPDTAGQEAASGGTAAGAGVGGEKRPPARRGKSKESPVDAVSHGLAMSAPDGNTYLLRGTDPARLYVVSPAGEVVREFEIRAPAPGLSPLQMAMAGSDEVFIQFGHIATGAPGEDNGAPRLITVFDPNTGLVTAVYRRAGTVSDFNLAACASSPYNFLFVGTSENNKLKVVRYSPLGF